MSLKNNPSANIKQMNEIKLYFGKVVSVSDDMKLNRIKVAIDGFTDKLSVDDLDWYYPFFGVHFIPVINDTVPVIILDDNFTTGFYNHRISLTDLQQLSSLNEGSEYENYVELYNRLNVRMTYKESEGIVHENHNSKSVIETDKIRHSVGSNQIMMVEDRIDLGNNGEPAPLGDKTVNALLKHIDLQNKHFDLVTDMLQGLAIKLSAISMTRGAGKTLLPKVIAAKASWPTQSKSVETYDKTIRSVKNFIE